MVKIVRGKYKQVSDGKGGDKLADVQKDIDEEIAMNAKLKGSEKHDWRTVRQVFENKINELQRNKNIQNVEKKLTEIE